MAPTASFASNYFSESERNDSYSAANFIPAMPFSIFGERNDRNGKDDEDYFEFKAPSSGRYAFLLQVRSATDQDLYLYDSKN